jgi:hypothetical protein
MKRKQYLLMYLKDKTRLKNKITRDTKVMEVEDEYWFGLERVVRLAN